MDIETYLIDLKSFFNDIIISGVNYMPMSIIKKLKVYSDASKNYNLFTLNSLIDNFINNNAERETVFIDISLWLDIAIIEYENFSVNE